MLNEQLIKLRNNGNMSTISLEGMVFHSYHGCLPEEKVTGNTFIIDLYIDADTAKAEDTDDLNDTVNYSAAYAIVKKEMEQPSKLLEHVARRILDSLKAAIPAIENAKVKVSKLNPPVGGEVRSVSVSLTS